MITYTKQINSLQSYKQIDGESNVVFNVGWSLVGEENGYISTYSLSTSVPYVAGQPFVPFADLTQADVESWIDQYTSPEQMQQYENCVNLSLQEQQNQDSPPLPWVPAPTPPEPPIPLGPSPEQSPSTGP